MSKAISLILALLLFFLFFPWAAVSSENDPILDRARNRSYITDPERMYPLAPSESQIQQNQQQTSSPDSSPQTNWVLILIVSNAITFIAAILVSRWYG